LDFNCATLLRDRIVVKKILQDSNSIRENVANWNLDSVILDRTLQQCRFSFATLLVIAQAKTSIPLVLAAALLIATHRLLGASYIQVKAGPATQRLRSNKCFICNMLHSSGNVAVTIVSCLSMRTYLW